MEMKFFGQVLEETVHRGFIRTNCARKLGIQKIEQEHKNPWTDEEIQRVSAELTMTAKFGWMHVTFLMGLYQAVRLRQSVVPIHFIDLDRGVINYPGKIVKGRKGFSQPIDPTFAPTLKAIMEHRRSIREQALCTLPENRGIYASLESTNFRRVSSAEPDCPVLTRSRSQSLQCPGVVRMPNSN
jgi:hypothetical protein